LVIKRLFKIEEAIDARLKKQAKRNNKNYPGPMLHLDMKRLPTLKGWSAPHCQDKKWSCLRCMW